MSKSQNNLTENMQKLDTIVAWFQNEEITVEEALGQYEKGIELAETIKQQLKDLKGSVTVLERRFDQSG